MARAFTPQEAQRVIEAHKKLLSLLETAAMAGGGLKADVLSAVGSMVEKEVVRMLESVPVEELNRDKRGIRTKVLRDNGYDTMAKVFTASERRITAISGIGPESAREIKQVAKEWAERIREDARIRISADDKCRQATRLVHALYVYKESMDDVNACRSAVRAHRDRIWEAIAALQPGLKGLGWILVPRVQKRAAEDAYEFLASMLRGSYATEAKAHLTELEKIGGSKPAAAWKDFGRDPIGFFVALEELCPGVLGTEDGKYGLPEELAEEIDGEEASLEGLKCTLRRYQLWGVKYILHQKKVLLGDEMGLGKTIQAIAAMVSLRNQGATHFLVICPASVLANWCREIRKHSDLEPVKIHGDRKEEAMLLWIEEGGVAVTTYETTLILDLPEQFRFEMLVVDEAHYIKNPEAQRTRRARRLCGYCGRLLFMTGTALENRVAEMIELITILNPGVAEQVRKIAFMSTAPQFREKVAPVYYRRKRDDVLTELPELIESREWCSMTEEETAIYEETVLNGSFMEARRLSWNVPDLSRSTKARRLLEIVEEAKEEDRKVIVFTFFLENIRRIRELLGDRCVDAITGSVSPQRRQEIIDDFEKAPAGTVLVSQIQSGGTGLNIQAASVVVICEPQFKPSIENQAISRAYRMGQSRNVLVYRLLCEDTLDERISDLLEEKQMIFDAFADESVAAAESLELDERTFGTIMAEEVERIRGKGGDVDDGIS